MKIGNFELQPGQPYFIAEVGSNFRTFEDCVESVHQAAKAQANAVKFQLFTHKALYGIPQNRNSGYDDAHEFRVEWLPKLKSECDRSRIDLIMTSFDHETVRSVDPYVVAHKVASSDIGYTELLTEVNKMAKPVILSTGASTQFEIQAALLHLPSVQKVILYCVAAYPAKAVDLTVMDKLQRIHPQVGFSDHTLDYAYIPYAAAKFHGALVIEKHFSAIDGVTPDSRHSLSPAEFRAMVDKVRGRLESWPAPVEEERDMLERGKRRLIAIEPISQGDLFKRGKNFGLYRSIHPDLLGLPPNQAAHIHNRVASRDIEPGEAIKATDIARS